MTTPHTPESSERDIVLSAEKLQVGVVRVPRERVRISKRITTEVRTLEVPVRVEQLVVRHEPLDGSDATGASGEAPEELVLVLHEEVPEVSLRVRPTEQVRVRVRQVTGRQVVSDVLRHEEVDLTVDELPQESRTAQP
ncbi:uncharacterized protein (TIGR02271 family) [Kineococcus xinjiangensis]|uniref:Uncharacterized protein (TIGR02271 family) n=1 Tax=Kineococcus xinjiangensis TaxID=512762 RepID=A0A2S6ITR4_9ACTN|nr:DUF2382 domain-containing protein [Kineococcus xinjiangensis]PPK97446.1 uncharacterized protein (TIGR02271 family) [Kineococcus xinjiangensis]